MKFGVMLRTRKYGAQGIFSLETVTIDAPTPHAAVKAAIRKVVEAGGETDGFSAIMASVDDIGRLA